MDLISTNLYKKDALYFLALCGGGFWFWRWIKKLDASYKREIEKVNASVGERWQEVLNHLEKPVVPPPDSKQAINEALATIKKDSLNTLATKNQIVDLQASVTESIKGIVKSPPVTVLSPTDQQLLAKLFQQLSGLPNFDKSLRNAEGHIKNLAGSLSSIDSNQGKLVESIARFNHSIAPALQQLESIHARVDAGAKELSVTAADIKRQLLEKGDRLSGVETAVLDLQKAAAAFHEKGDRAFAEGERVRAEITALQEQRETANNAHAASQAAMQKARELQMQNSDLVKKAGEDRARAEAALKQAQETLAAEVAARTQAVREREKAETERAQARQLHDQTVQAKVQTDRQNAELARKEEAIQVALAQQALLEKRNQELLAAVQHERAAAEVLRQTAASDRAVAESTLVQSKAERVEVAEQYLRVQKLSGSLWPEAFSDQGSLAESRKEIEQWIAQQNSEAEILLSALYRFRAVANSTNRQEMYDMLRDVSRYAYRCWKSERLNASECAVRAQLWAQGLKHNGGAFELRVAKPGMAKDINWMNFKPGEGPQVADVLTWAVFDEGSMLKRKAEVV